MIDAMFEMQAGLFKMCDELFKLDAGRKRLWEQMADNYATNTSVTNSNQDTGNNSNAPGSNPWLRKYFQPDVQIH
jgi:hypothetical protein